MEEVGMIQNFSVVCVYLTKNIVMRYLILAAILTLVVWKTHAQQPATCTWEFPKTIMISESSEPDYGVKISCTCALKKVKITVYNRWGEELYTTDQFQHVWKGENTPTGVYMIVAEGVYTNGEKFKEQASVNYFR